MGILDQLTEKKDIILYLKLRKEELKDELHKINEELKHNVDLSEKKQHRLMRGKYHLEGRIREVGELLRIAHDNAFKTEGKKLWKSSKIDMDDIQEGVHIHKSCLCTHKNPTFDDFEDLDKDNKCGCAGREPMPNTTTFSGTIDKMEINGEPVDFKVGTINYTSEEKKAMEKPTKVIHPQCQDQFLEDLIKRCFIIETKDGNILLVPWTQLTNPYR